MDQEKRQYGPAEGEEIKYLRNPLPVPARRAHSVMEFDLQEEDLPAAAGPLRKGIFLYGA